VIKRRVGHRALGLAMIVGIGGAVVAVTATRASRPTEERAVRLASAQRAAGDRAGALASLLACATRAPRACACADDAAELAIDLGRYPEAWQALEHSECAPSPRHLGARAEALVATGRVLEGAHDADEALALDAREPHACFARAWALGTGPEARALAQRAVDGGRGVPALLLTGSLRMNDGDLAGALMAFEQAEQLAPSDARTAFNVALVAQKQGRFRDAREGYLRALALDPKMADARYNLVLLTHGVGANDEANHDLDELERIAPDDARIGALRATLGRK
jgi:tetratricopeptide (TPR) repeat protein